jgi:tetratricopeptide (TPR) repeat protein
MNKTYWLYTDSSIFELSVTEEDQDLWSVYLDKQAFESALKYTKTPKQRSIVNAAQGDAYFTQGRYIQSAEAYAQSTKSFEEVVLRFTDKDERDALRYYLVRCLERLKKNVRAVGTMVRAVLPCWALFPRAGSDSENDAGYVAGGDSS